MKSWLQTIVFLLLSILIVLLDVAFFPAMGNMIFVNLILTVSLFILVIFNMNLGTQFFIVSVVLSDLTSGSFLLMHLIGGIMVLMLMNWLFESFFTNRSYYSLIAIGFLGWSIYYLIVFIATLTIRFFDSSAYTYTITTAWLKWILVGLSVELLILSLLYTSTVIFHKGIKSYFIVSRD